MRLIKFFWGLTFCILLSSFASVEGKQQSPVQAQLVAEEQSIQGGRPFWVGVELQMEEGWDTYWRNPGDAGMPTEISWQLPPGFQVGEVLWPYPERFVNDNFVGFGYTDAVLLLAEITPPEQASLDKKEIEIAADVSWLACKDSCVPGEAHLSLHLPVTDEVPHKNEQTTSLFQQARTKLPQQTDTITASTQGEKIVLHFKDFKEATEVLFIPEQGDIVDYESPQEMHNHEEGIDLHIKRSSVGDLPQQVKGVLLFSEKAGGEKKAFHINASLLEHVSSAAAGSYFWVTLACAFLGGMILNVMPCVLPVIALKIFGFIQIAQKKRSLIFKHGLFFTAGVLLSFCVLSGILLLLRASGESVGWGFQLQNPLFVVVLTMILFLLGLSLFGVFEIGTSLINLGGKTSSFSSPIMSSFMSGVLATLVATPCTGPLLGPALGFAMTLPTTMALIIFLTMGLGMAFPYLFLSAFPHLVRYLPKPGNWMVIFKQLMGFLMFATVIWLIWVFGTQTDAVAVSLLLCALLILAIAGWIFGKWVNPLRGKITRFVAMTLSALILILGGSTAIVSAKQFLIEDASSAQGENVAAVGQEWESFSPERLYALRKEGKPVFVDFTARWCLICQANKVILHSAHVKKAFAEKGVVMMIADWTKKDDVITQELQKLGRSGVPVYVLYPPNPEEAPYLLPQTLTKNVLYEYLEKLASPWTDRVS